MRVAAQLDFRHSVSEAEKRSTWGRALALPKLILVGSENHFCAASRVVNRVLGVHVGSNADSCGDVNLSLQWGLRHRYLGAQILLWEQPTLVKYVDNAASAAA